MARKPSSFIEFPLIRRQDKDSFFESPFAKFWAPTWHIRLLFKFSSTKVLFATRTLPFLMSEIRKKTIFSWKFHCRNRLLLSVFGFFREREKVSQICIHPRSSFLRAPQIMWWQRGEQEPECEVQASSQIFKGS